MEWSRIRETIKQAEWTESEAYRKFQESRDYNSEYYDSEYYDSEY